MTKLECLEVINIVVDECHLVISWGNDFRPAFLKFSSILKRLFPNAPVIAMTSTANSMSITEISVQLQLKSYVVLKSPINRSNLIINIKETNDSNDELCNIFKTSNYASKTMKTIIFCRTKKLVDSVVAYLKTINVPDIYHYYSNMKADMNKPNWAAFIEAQSGTMVCTCGFGTGIDVKNVNIVIHIGAPKTIEDYYQEIGRGGRGGELCTCYLFFESNDFRNDEFNTRQIKDLNYKKLKKSMYLKVKRFLFTYECRRKHILKELDDEEIIKTSANCCDNCNNKKCPLDLSNDCKRLMTVIKFAKDKDFGNEDIIDIMCNKSNNKIKKFKLQEQAIVKNLQDSEKNTDKYWTQLLKMLIYGGYIDLKFLNTYDSPYVSQIGENAIANSLKIKLMPTLKFREIIDQSVHSPNTQADSKGAFLIPTEVKYQIQCSSLSQKELFNKMLETKNNYLDSLESDDKILANLSSNSVVKSIILKMEMPNKTTLPKELFDSLELILKTYIKEKCDQLYAAELSDQIKTAYTEFEIKNLSLSETAIKSGKLHRNGTAYAEQTIAIHLSECVLSGLEVNWLRLNISDEMINKFDDALTTELNRNCKTKKDVAAVWTNIYPQIKPYGVQFHITFNLIKRKYGVGTEKKLETSFKRSGSNEPQCLKKLKFADNKQ